MRQPTGVCAVIVLYQPDLGVLSGLIEGILDQVDRITVVNNGSSSETAVELERMERANGVHVIHCADNVGVAAAHNLGIEWARAMGCSYVLLLDQDSIPATSMVEELLNAVDVLRRRSISIAAVGPRYVDAHTGIASPFARLGRFRPERVSCPHDNTNDLIETDFLISSGSLIPVEVFERVGLMDAGLFIDHVDTDWVFRAKHFGYSVFGVCSASMRHSLGSATLRFWFLRWRNAPLHSPERHYYAFRNSLLLFRRPYAPWRWIVNDLTMLTYMWSFYPLFAPQRMRRIHLMMKGIWHGVRGVQGPLK
jgi:rhamnosyltransferase